MRNIQRMLGCKSRLYCVEIRTGAAGVWYWRVVSKVNGQVLATSETYSTFAACSETATSVARDAGFLVSVSQPQP